MKKDLTRNQAIEKLVAAKLRTQATTHVPARRSSCLDPETLAAYVERALVPGERLSAETHLATCLGCQAVVAELVRLSEGEAPAEFRAAALRGRPGISWFRWAWAASAVFGLVVFGLWYRAGFEQSQRPPQMAALQTAAPNPTAQPEALPTTPQAPPTTRQEPPEAGRYVPATPEALKRRAPGAQKGPAADKVAVLGGQSPTSKELAGRAATTEQLERPINGREAAGVATPGDRAQLAKAPSSEVPALGEPADSRDAPTARGAEPPAPAAPLRAESEKQKAEAKESISGFGAAGAAMPHQNAARATRGVVAEEASISASRGWRVGAHGLIQKPGVDNFRMTVPSGVTTDLNEITFPTPSAGWVVGQAGTVLRSLDGGSTWVKISIPTSEDLVRVTASSDQAARIVTRSGQTLATTDGGQSWTNLRQ